MNEIAAKLGEVGLPKPVKELARTTWDALIELNPVIVHGSDAVAVDALAQEAS